MWGVRRLFDWLLEDTFRKRPHGESVVYPYGPLGRGRILTGPAETKVRRFLKLNYAAIFVAVPMLTTTEQGVLVLGGVIVLFLAAYEIGTRVLLRGTPFETRIRDVMTDIPFVRTDPHSICVILCDSGTREPPTIVLDVGRPASRLPELCRRLAEAQVPEVELLREPFVEAFGIASLTLRRVDRERFGETVRRRRSAGETDFTWSRDAEGWLETAEKLDALADAARAGVLARQELGAGDATIEASAGPP